VNLVDELIEVANAFGAAPEYSRAGGGNASVKVDGVLRIKPSGVPLATLRAEDLVGLRNDVLLASLESDAPVDGDPVMAAAAKALVDAPSTPTRSGPTPRRSRSCRRSWPPASRWRRSATARGS
jgi:rhamnose utilization protein RhaD (predicted bifunctional aldolase and dehydrogenase)